MGTQNEPETSCEVFVLPSEVSVVFNTSVTLEAISCWLLNNLGIGLIRSLPEFLLDSYRRHDDISVYFDESDLHLGALSWLRTERACDGSCRIRPPLLEQSTRVVRQLGLDILFVTLFGACAQTKHWCMPLSCD